MGSAEFIPNGAWLGVGTVVGVGPDECGVIPDGARLGGFRGWQ